MYVPRRVVSHRVHTRAFAKRRHARSCRLLPKFLVIDIVFSLRAKFSHRIATNKRLIKGCIGRVDANHCVIKDRSYN